MAKRTISKASVSRSLPARSATADPRPDNANDRSDQRDNLFKFDITKSSRLSRDLGPGDDHVEIKGNDGGQIRLTFTSADVGNGTALDGNNATNEDGGLAVRVQAENGAGGLTGPVSRFDDEGITFTTKDDATFDVRDLPTGTERGNFFDVVILGTSGTDTFDETGSSEAYYINAGMGNDTVIGGLANDFLVGGGGNDSLFGREGNDSFVGGSGDDMIVGGTGDDTAILGIAVDGSDSVDLGTGNDRVVFIAATGSQIRITFSNNGIGNDNPLDSALNTNQDGGLAVRIQLEDATGALIGPVSRFDDEGISFIGAPGQTFDVRELVSGAQPGDQYDVVRMGTSANDTISDAGRAIRHYTDGGGGNDTLVGGTLFDALVGGFGTDRLDGREGNDNLVGGAGVDTFIFTGVTGNDRIIDFLANTDKIDLSAFGITAANVTSAVVGPTTVLSVDTTLDGLADFTITLVNGATPLATDYIF